MTSGSVEADGQGKVWDGCVVKWLVAGDDRFPCRVLLRTVRSGKLGHPGISQGQKRLLCGGGSK